jgi:prepilin-type N-terminal cleavage/methylation domain-containing protein
VTKFGLAELLVVIVIIAVVTGAGYLIEKAKARRR